MTQQTDEFYIKRVKNASLTEDTSITTYIANMKKVIALTKATGIHDLLINPEKYKQILKDTIPNLNTLISYYIAIITFMKNSNLKTTHREEYNNWYTDMMAARRERNKLLLNNIPSERQQRTNYSWSEIIAKRDSYSKDSIEHLLLGIYTYVPPRRQKDYAWMRVYTDSKFEPKRDHNHFHINHPTYGPYMFINEFKTAKYMSSFFNKEIPKELVEVIKLSMKKHPREYLFVRADGESYDRVNAFTKFSNNLLKSIFQNKEMTVNALRHAHATEINNRPGVTFAERSRSAYKMGHTVKKDLIYAFKDTETKVKLPDIPKDMEGYDICYRYNKTTGKLEPFKCPKF